MLADGAVANTLPFAETPIPTSRKSSSNAFTTSKGGPTLPAVWAMAGAAASAQAATRIPNHPPGALVFFTGSMPLEILPVALVLLRRRAQFEGAEIPALAGLG